jgi:hypothetical protein
MVNNVPMQGDIIKINLDPKQGHEQKGYRTYDYNARQWNYIETVSNDFLEELLKKVVVVFQSNNLGK